jgi:hypothetical protein
VYSLSCSTFIHSFTYLELTMKKTKTPAVAAPVVSAEVVAEVVTPKAPARIPAIGTLINEAGQAAASMLAKCKEAASKAAKQLNSAKPMNERIAEVVALYKVDFDSAGHNVKSLFVDALTLHAAAKCPVSVQALGADGKRAETHTTAAVALDMPKHAMREAAKQVREVHGMGRKSGAGRKAAKTTPAKPDPAVISESVDAFSAWLDNLGEYLTDAVYHPKIMARLIELGYTLGKAGPRRTVRGAASI